MRRLVLAIGVVCLCAGGLQAQSLGDVAKKTEEQRAKTTAPVKVYTNQDIGAPVAEAAPSYTPAEAVIDRSKFDKVYLAGKAVDEGKFMGAVGVSPRQFDQLLQTFNTEISVASDKLTTKAEKALASKYVLVYLEYSFGSAARLDPTKHYGLDSMTKAGDDLAAANKTYLGKDTTPTKQ